MIIKICFVDIVSFNIVLIWNVFEDCINIKWIGFKLFVKNVFKMKNLIIVVVNKC